MKNKVKPSHGINLSATSHTVTIVMIKTLFGTLLYPLGAPRQLNNDDTISCLPREYRALENDVMLIKSRSTDISTSGHL